METIRSSRMGWICLPVLSRRIIPLGLHTQAAPEPCQAYHTGPGARGTVGTTDHARMMVPYRRRRTMKKAKRIKAQKRQQALQRRRQHHLSTRRPVTQIPPESADQIAMTTTGEILQLIRL